MLVIMYILWWYHGTEGREYRVQGAYLGTQPNLVQSLEAYMVGSLVLPVVIPSHSQEWCLKLVCLNPLLSLTLKQTNNWYS